MVFLGKAWRFRKPEKQKQIRSGEFGAKASYITVGTLEPELLEEVSKTRRRAHKEPPENSKGLPESSREPPQSFKRAPEGAQAVPREDSRKLPESPVRPHSTRAPEEIIVTSV